MKTYYGRPSDKREIEEKRDKLEAKREANMRHAGGLAPIGIRPWPVVEGMAMNPVLLKRYAELLKEQRSLDEVGRKVLTTNRWELYE